MTGSANNLPVVLTSSEFRNALADQCKLSTRSVLIASAYITAPAMEWLLKQLAPGRDAVFIARWARRDLVCGASDFESYYLARSRGHEFLIDPTLHTKAYLFDDETVFIGSANLTSRGLSLDGLGNQEHVTMFKPSIRDVTKLTALRLQSTELTDSLVRQMEEVADAQSHGTDDWPPAVKSALASQVRGLWVADMPLAQPPMTFLATQTQLLAGELQFIDCDVAEYDADQIRDLFLGSKAWHWLRRQLAEHGEMRFGHVTALLHDALLDDPAPYRSKVKILVENLFGWVEFACPTQVTVVQHQHTRSLRML